MSFYALFLTHLFSVPFCRALVFLDAVRVLGAGMVVKYQKYTAQLWRDCVSSLVKIVQIGLPTLEDSGMRDTLGELVGGGYVGNEQQRYGNVLTYNSSGLFSKDAEGQRHRQALWEVLTESFEHFLFHDK